MEDIILQWIKLSKELKQLKQEELLLRKKISNNLAMDKLDRINLDDQKILLKCKYVLNYKIDEEELRNIWDHLTMIERSAINFRPSLSKTMYKKIPQNSVLHKAIVIDDGAPQLSWIQL